MYAKKNNIYIYIKNIYKKKNIYIYIQLAIFQLTVKCVKSMFTLSRYDFND